MGKGVIKIEAKHGAEWFEHGKGHGHVPELLKLPKSYSVEHIKTDDDGHLYITVASKDIPECDEGIPDLVAQYDAIEGRTEGRWEKPESYKLTSLTAHLPLKVE